MNKFLIIVSLLLITSCSFNIGIPDKYIEKGVSKELAIFRKANIKNVCYNLNFSIPEWRDSSITGVSKIEFALEEDIPVVLDFKADPEQIVRVSVNGTTSSCLIQNEHIIIPQNETVQGSNTIEVHFKAADQSLNRRDQFLYTLLVPDRARTLFPCFDQPDIKALYNLSLEIPENWRAVANGPIKYSQQRGQKRRIIQFNQTEPLSSYLFSFVAGVLNKADFSRGKRNISIYHRETDNKKIAQCQDIANEVFDSLEWLEEYTGIEYPFAKYDLIILPGFQYGGMEHTGATLYNDTKMFLNENPTINERLARSSLIAHETAHMWFGDYVTMEWFDDVWTKEVFANYFASRIVEPQFKEINHRLNFIMDYIPSAYSEDRTDGANPIKQNLDNLNNAGLVYGNIIYNKSPVVMEMLVQKIGETNFRIGIREYLTTYAYGNATWEGLVKILDKYTAENLEEWSYTWVNKPGMPVIDVPDGTIPNIDGRSYGYFKLTENWQREIWNIVLKSNDVDSDVMKGSLLITLYENLRRKNMQPEIFMANILQYLQKEQNPLLYSLALGYAEDCFSLYLRCNQNSSDIEDILWKIISTHPKQSFRLQAFRSYRNIASSSEGLARLYDIWKYKKVPAGVVISENDYINLSYTLALNFPDSAKNILKEQFSRISNPDRQEQFRFIAPSVSANKSVRDSVFLSLLEAENRRIEPWAATALGYLNHHLRQDEALEYILPALEEIEEVQQTGDIFFPRTWARALLSGHHSKAASEKVEEFFAQNPDYPHMLKLKIKQQAWHLKL